MWRSATAGSTACANSIDAVSYRIRFTPRKPTSTWSAINVKRVAELDEARPDARSGHQGLRSRKGDKTGIYAYEQRKTAKLPPGYERKFRANKKAWAFFQSQPPWYQRTATYRVISAKQEATREKRLAELIRDSEAGLSIKELRAEKELAGFQVTGLRSRVRCQASPGHDVRRTGSRAAKRHAWGERSLMSEIASRVENRRSNCSLPVDIWLGFRRATAVRFGLVLFPVAE